jgi:hypothetical protein
MTGQQHKDVLKAPRRIKGDWLPANRHPINQAAKPHLGSAADPGLPYLLQLAEKGLNDPDLGVSRRSAGAMATQLEVLKGADPKVAMRFLAPPDNEPDLPSDPKEAAIAAAQQLDSRMTATVQGYPPASRHAMV